MGWRLADATPRRVMLDTGFMHGLRNILGWEFDRSLSLSDLHPSYGNLDHLRCFIHNVWLDKFPHGTDFEGRHYCIIFSGFLICKQQFNKWLLVLQANLAAMSAVQKLIH